MNHSHITQGDIQKFNEHYYTLNLESKSLVVAIHTQLAIPIKDVEILLNQLLHSGIEVLPNGEPVDADGNCLISLKGFYRKNGKRHSFSWQGHLDSHILDNNSVPENFDDWVRKCTQENHTWMTIPAGVLNHPFHLTKTFILKRIPENSIRDFFNSGL